MAPSRPAAREESEREGEETVRVPETCVTRRHLRRSENWNPGACECIVAFWGDGYIMHVSGCIMPLSTQNEAPCSVPASCEF